MGENLNTNCVEKRQNRPLGIRLLGVPPSTIYKNSNIILRALLRCGKIKTRNFSKNVKIDPQENVYQGSPPLLSTKTPKYIERTRFLWAKIKTRTFSKNVKIDLQEYI